MNNDTRTRTIYDVTNDCDMTIDTFKRRIECAMRVTFKIDDDDTFIIASYASHNEHYVIASRDDATLSRNAYACALSCDLIVATSREYRELIISE